MTNEEAIVRDYLQKAHDRGGGWEMAMRMMAARILLLGDAIACYEIAASPPDGCHRPVPSAPSTPPPPKPKG